MEDELYQSLQMALVGFGILWMDYRMSSFVMLGYGFGSGEWRTLNKNQIYQKSYGDGLSM